MSERDRRKQVMEWMEEHIEGQEAVDLPDLTNRAVDHFLHDEDFAREALAEVLRPVVYDLGKRILANTRHEAVVELGDEVVTRSEFKARAERLQSRFARWMEHARGQYVNFMEMQKEDLLDAAFKRERRASTEAAIAAFERRVAGPMKVGQKVGDLYTPEQLEAMWRDFGSGEVA